MPSAFQKRYLLAFILSCLALMSLFQSLQHADRRAALMQLERTLTQDREILTTVTPHCPAFNDKKLEPGDRFLLKKKASQSPEACFLTLQKETSEQFLPYVQWNFRVLVTLPKGQTLFQKNYLVQTLKPILLWPGLIFLLGLVFHVSFSGYSIGWLSTLLVFLGLLVGGNCLYLLQLSFELIPTTFRTESTLFGFLCLSIWGAILKYRHTDGDRVHWTFSQTLKKFPQFIRPFQRSFSTLLGLWSPALFTILSPCLASFKKLRLEWPGLIMAQSVLLALSFYFFNLEGTSFFMHFYENLFSPRYFTLGMLLFLSLSSVSPSFCLPQKKYRLDGGLLSILFILLIESLYATEWIVWHTPLINRIGFALLCAELIRPKGIRWKAVAYLSGRTCFALMGVSLFMVLLSELGFVELITSMVDPRRHPNLMTFYIYFGGFLLSLFTGSLTLSYFSFTALMSDSFTDANMQSALLDGILCGVLLSPYSLFNVLPAVHLRTGIRPILKMRIEHLGLPFLIATLIYGISAMSTVRILQPVTFVFICLAFIVFRLQSKQFSQIQAYSET